MGVEGGDVEAVAPGGEAAIDSVAAQREVLRERLLVVPELRPGLAVDPEGVVPRGRDVHDPVDHQGRTLKAVEHTGLERPGGDQAGDVPGVDLVERAVPLGVVGAGVDQPVGVFGAGLLEVIVVDRADQRRLLRRLGGQGLRGAYVPCHGAEPGGKANRGGGRRGAGTWAVRCVHGSSLGSPRGTPAGISGDRAMPQRPWAATRFSGGRRPCLARRRRRRGDGLRVSSCPYDPGRPAVIILGAPGQSSDRPGPAPIPEGASPPGVPALDVGRGTRHGRGCVSGRVREPIPAQSKVPADIWAPSRHDVAALKLEAQPTSSWTARRSAYAGVTSGDATDAPPTDARHLGIGPLRSCNAGK